MGDKCKEVGDKPAGNPRHPAWETNEKNRETIEKKWETNEKTDHKHPAWETNEKKWETSRPGTRPDHPAPRRPFFKALRTPNSKLFGE